MPPSPEANRELRARILEAAVALFAERGYGSTSMREVAERVGCTKPALYYWFDSKERLFAEGARDALNGFTTVIEAALAGEDPVAARLVRFTGAYLDHARTHPQSVRLLMAATHGGGRDVPRVDLMDLHLRNALLVRGLLAQGAQTGQLRADLDLDDATMALIGVVHLRALASCMPMPVTPPPADPARIVDLLLRGLQA